MKYRPRRIRERFLAFMTNIPLFNLTVYADVAFSDLTSCATVNIRAKYFLWVHWLYSFGVVTAGFCL
jgi:hypothetical protein